MSENKKKEKSLTIRLSQKVYDLFTEYMKVKSEEIGTKLTQAQAFEIIVREQSKQ